MKAFCVSLGLLGWLLSIATASAEPRSGAPLLVFAVSAADEAAAERFVQLAAQPCLRARASEAREPAWTLRALEQSSAAQAVVLDGELSLVYVLERDGRARSRAIAADPTPYL